MNMKTELETGMENINSSRDKLSKEIATAADAAGDRLRQFSGQQLESAKEALSEARTRVTASAIRLAGSSGGYVHTHPWQAMGAAAAAGVVLGLLLARR